MTWNAEFGFPISHKEAIAAVYKENSSFSQLRFVLSLLRLPRAVGSHLTRASRPAAICASISQWKTGFLPMMCMPSYKPRMDFYGLELTLDLPGSMGSGSRR